MLVPESLRSGRKVPLPCVYYQRRAGTVDLCPEFSHCVGVASSSATPDRFDSQADESVALNSRLFLYHLYSG